MQYPRYKVRPSIDDRQGSCAVVLGYVIAFSSPARALSLGLPVGAACGVWTASGVAMPAVLARYLFGDQLTRITAAGIALIVIGV